MTRALLLFSGGLDSLLTAKILKKQGIEVTGLVLTGYVFDYKQAERSADMIKLPHLVHDVAKEHLAVVKNPLHGYGKDITTGKGRFELSELESVDELNFNAKTFMSLSPFAINFQNEIEDIFYEPFVRFGKFGGKWAHYNAFKKPILFANSASVIVFKEKKERKFIGQAITDIALSDDPKQNQSIQQGYTILFPLKDLECKQ